LEVDLEQLERFERETARAAEAAFHLAHNAAVSRFILDAVKAPESSEVAFALDDPEDGPFLVATRDGAAVRCLKRGARPKMPLVTRAMIERAVQPHDALRGEVMGWSAPQVGASGFRATIRRLFSEGDRVTRGDLRTLAPFLPLFGEKLPALWYAADEVIRDFVKRAGERLLAEKGHLDSRSAEQVRRTWRLHWAVGHLQALFAQVDDDALRQMAGAVIQGAAPLRAMRFGYWPVALRGLSLCGRLGPSLMTGLERGLSMAPDAVNEALPSVHGIAFVGAAHPKYRSEIGGLLASMPERQRWDDPRTMWLIQESEVLAGGLAELVTSPTEAAKTLLERLHALQERDLGDLPELPDGKDAEQDPFDFVVMLANRGLDHHGRLARVLLRYGLGAFARTPIEDLYPRFPMGEHETVDSDPLGKGLEMLSIAVEHVARLRRRG